MALPEEHASFRHFNKRDQRGSFPDCSRYSKVVTTFDYGMRSHLRGGSLHCDLISPAIHFTYILFFVLSVYFHPSPGRN
jgi:hypothetical protein